jgi:hypothetical protein
MTKQEIARLDADINLRKFIAANREEVAVIDRVASEAIADDTANTAIENINNEQLVESIRFHTNVKSLLKNMRTSTGMLSLFASDKVTGTALYGAQYILYEARRSDITNEEGECSEDLIQPGYQSGAMFMDGYKTLPFKFKIVAGKITNLELFMEKV